MTLARVRKTEGELIKQWQALKGTQQADLIVELLELKLERLKEDLLRITQADFPRLQGEAKTYNDLLKLLTKEPLNINKV